MTWTDPSLAACGAGFLAAAWLTPRSWQGRAMAAAGAAFVAWISPTGIAWLAACGAAAYGAGRVRHRFPPAIAIAAIAIAACMIGLRWRTRLGEATLATPAFALGVSFYGLRVLHYLVETNRGTLPAPSPGEFARYLLFAPTFVAGPINRFAGFQRDERRRQWSPAMFARGLERVLYGYVKIVVVANWLLTRVLGEWARQADLAAWQSAYLECARYGLNLYFQFSGYSDVAVGLALAAGFRIEENFRWPFVARNMVEFWQRWHITLSSWCRDYVFAPVSAATRNAFVGVGASMVVLGLWHELSLRYAVWGACHAAGIAVSQVLRRAVPTPPRSRVARALLGLGAWALTQNFVVLTFALTSAPDLAQAWRRIVTILTFAGR